MRTLWLTLAFPAIIIAGPPTPVGAFIQHNCVSCHNAKVKQNNLDLTSLPFNPAESANFARWVRIYDRVHDGEMPPVKLATLTPASRERFLNALARPLVAADHARAKTSGRAVWRRMNRYEYE